VKIAVRGLRGLPDDTISFTSMVRPGRKLRAFLAPGVRSLWKATRNDYTGKGLSGAGSLSPPKTSTLRAEENIVVARGAYGRNHGEAFSMDGRRALRRRATPAQPAVVEGVGDRRLRVQTKGLAVILGRTGRTSPPGMSEASLLSLMRTGSFVKSSAKPTVDLEPASRIRGYSGKSQTD